MTTQQRAATRIGIVGLGRAGGIHFDALQAVQNAEVAAVCDVSAESRSRAERLAIPAYVDLDAMLGVPE